MPILTRDQILRVDDLPRETVPVPEWGGEVVVRTLSGAERAAMVEGYVAASKADPEAYFPAHLVAAALVDQDGQPLCTPGELLVRSGAVLERLYAVARRLNGYDREALKKSSPPTAN